MPAHSSTAGLVILDEAFALGKMHDSSGWNGLLRNKITPSDIDLCFDNNGAIIFIDLSISCDSWEAVLVGQRRVYEAVVAHGPHCAVVCKHSVGPALGRKIDTLRDIERFQVMVWDFEPVLSPIYDGVFWQNFVMFWVNNPGGPLKLRRHILGLKAGLVRASTTEPPTDAG